MTTLEPLTLTGQHVRLEPLLLEHAPGLLAVADESRATYGLTIVPRDLAGMEAYVATALAEQARGDGLPFVVRAPYGALLGSTRFTAVERWAWPGPPTPPLPEGPDAVEIGYTWYAERAQRTAVNTEAKLLLCAHAFERWGVRRVTWKTDARNARSRAAILRLGARFDGILRAHRPAADGGVRDTAFFSMLASEWPAARLALTARLSRPAASAGITASSTS
jgi:RimJ/RimL family protein N-acetyltransferase